MGVGQSVQTDQDPYDDAVFYWRVFAWPSIAKPLGPALVSGRAFATGELLYTSYCLELGPRELEQSYIGGFLLDAPPRLDKDEGNGAVIRLLPLQLGLVLLSGGEWSWQREAPNVVSELVWEAPPPPPVPHETESSCEISRPAKPCAWLCFYAAKPIAEGESLKAAPPRTCFQRERGSVFDAARRHHFIDEWVYTPGEDDSECEDLEAPDTLIVPEHPPVVVGASRIHGVGMFATRDLESGEFVEYTPQLPVNPDHYNESDVVKNYTFESANFSGKEQYDSLVLGCGAIYNHSEDHAIDYWSVPDNPFLRKWCLIESVREGEEVYSSYGDEYWSTRGIKPDPALPPRSAHRWSLCAGT